MLNRREYMIKAHFHIDKSEKGFHIDTKGFSSFELFGLLFAELLKIANRSQHMFTDITEPEGTPVRKKSSVKKTAVKKSAGKKRGRPTGTTKKRK